jgi:hypothetical protein
MLGFYPVMPSGEGYVIGSPVFPKAVIHLDPDRPGARDLVIEAPGAAPDHPYVQSATWNGAPLDRPFLSWDQVRAGGVLQLQMGPEASSWGRAALSLTEPAASGRGGSSRDSPGSSNPATRPEDPVVVIQGGGRWPRSGQRAVFVPFQLPGNELADDGDPGTPSISTPAIFWAISPLIASAMFPGLETGVQQGLEFHGDRRAMPFQPADRQERTQDVEVLLSPDDLALQVLPEVPCAMWR